MRRYFPAALVAFVMMTMLGPVTASAGPIRTFTFSGLLDPSVIEDPALDGSVEGFFSIDLGTQTVSDFLFDTDPVTFMGQALNIELSPLAAGVVGPATVTSYAPAVSPVENLIVLTFLGGGFLNSSALLTLVFQGDLASFTGGPLYIPSAEVTVGQLRQSSLQCFLQGQGIGPCVGDARFLVGPTIFLSGRVDAVAPVPEPASMVLLGTGLVTASVCRWHSRRRRPASLHIPKDA